MSEFNFNGVVFSAYSTILSLKVATYAAIVTGDILVLDGVAGASGAGYVRRWNATTDPLFAIALHDLDNPGADGGATIQAAIIDDNLLVRVTATGITQGKVGQFCDINGKQSIDVTANSRSQALILVPEVAKGTALVRLYMTPTIDNSIAQGVS